MFSDQGKGWSLVAKAADAARTSIAIGETSSGPSLETPGLYSGIPSNSPVGAAYSMYGYLVPANFNNACGTTIYQNDYITYETAVIPGGLTTTLPEFTLNIVTVDTVAHTMSDTFAGIYWKGCDKLEVTDGEFNLPYTVQP